MLPVGVLIGEQTQAEVRFGNVVIYLNLNYRTKIRIRVT